MNFQEEAIKDKQRKGIEQLLYLCLSERAINSHKNRIIIVAILLFIHKKTVNNKIANISFIPDNKERIFNKIIEIAGSKLFTNYEDYDISEGDYSRSDFHKILPVLEKLSAGFYENAYKTLIKNFDNGVLPDVFYDFLIKGSNDKSAFNNRYFTPKLISEEIASLVKVKGETIEYDKYNNVTGRSSGETILNIGAGTGGMLAEVISQNLDKNIYFNAFEQDREIGLLGKLYLSLLDYKFDFQTWDIFGYDDLNAWSEREYDWIISDVPFGNKQEIEFLNFTIRVTAYKAILVVPENVLFSEDNQLAEIRKTLLENDWVEAIISYPYGILKPFSAVKLSILIINKKKRSTEEGKIKFEIISSDNRNLNIYTSNKDRDFRINRINSTKDVRYVLNSGGYLNANRYTNDYEDIKSSKTNLYPLEDIVSIKRGKKVDPNQLTTNNSGFPYLSIKNLSKDNELPYLNETNIEYYVDNSVDELKFPHTNGREILISIVGDKLNPTLVEKSSVVYSDRIISLKINNEFKAKILPEYLAFYLRSENIKVQHELFVSGAVIRTVLIQDIKKLLVEVLSIEEQNKFIQERIEKLFAREQKAYIEAKAKDILERASTLEHTLGNSVKVISNDIEMLIKFFDRENYNPVTKNHDDLEIAEKSRLLNILRRIQAEVKSSSFALQHVNDWRKVNKGTLHKEKVKLKDFFKQAIESGNFSEELIIEIIAPINLEAEIDKERFKILIRNFIQNAQKHAFVDSSFVEKKINFTISEKEDKSIQITVQNNGKIISEDFNLNKYLNSDSNKGLKLIYNITKAHDGIFEAFSKEECERLGVGALFIIQINKIDTDGENKNSTY